MKYGQLGKTGIEVSRLCVGCLSFGQPFSDSHMWTLNPEETDTIVRKALDLGFTFLIPQIRTPMAQARNTWAGRSKTAYHGIK